MGYLSAICCRCSDTLDCRSSSSLPEEGRMLPAQPLAHSGRHHRLHPLCGRSVGKPVSTATEDARRDAPLVFAVHDRVGMDSVYQVAIQMDSALLADSGYGVYRYQHTQTRHSRPEPHASLAERVVCTPCHGLHLLVQCLWLRLSAGCLRIVAAHRPLPVLCRPAGKDWHGVPHLRHALGVYLGETGVGQLLDMGPQGDLGSSYLVCLSRLYPPPYGKGSSNRFAHPLPSDMHQLHLAHRRIPAASDVLVWSQPAPLCQQQPAQLFLNNLYIIKLYIIHNNN